MTQIKHETKDTSTTPCRICREWERDMNGTTATLQKERQTSKDLLGSLEDVVRICKAMRFTVGLGKGQIERIERAEALIAKAKGNAA
jgi:hypothetical protein